MLNSDITAIHTTSLKNKMKSWVLYVVLLFILCARPCIAGDLISNIETAIVSNIQSLYGRGSVLNATEFQRFSDDVIPVKQDGGAQDMGACDYKTITEACSSTTKYAYCEQTISEKVFSIFNSPVHVLLT